MARAGNADGAYLVSAKRQMDAFDNLPRAARQALAFARMDFAVPPFLTIMRTDPYMTAVKLAQHVRDSDDVQIQRTRKRTWGKDYPA